MNILRVHPGSDGSVAVAHSHLVGVRHGDELTLLDPAEPSVPLLQISGVRDFALRATCCLVVDADFHVSRWDLRAGTWRQEDRFLVGEPPSTDKETVLWVKVSDSGAYGIAGWAQHTAHPDPAFPERGTMWKTEQEVYLFDVEGRKTIAPLRSAEHGSFDRLPAVGEVLIRQAPEPGADIDMVECATGAVIGTIKIHPKYDYFQKAAEYRVMAKGTRLLASLYDGSYVETRAYDISAWPMAGGGDSLPAPAVFVQPEISECETIIDGLPLEAADGTFIIVSTVASGVSADKFLEYRWGDEGAALSSSNVEIIETLSRLSPGSQLLARHVDPVSGDVLGWVLHPAPEEVHGISHYLAENRILIAGSRVEVLNGVTGELRPVGRLPHRGRRYDCSAASADGELLVWWPRE